MLHYTRNNRTCETSEELKVYHTRVSELSIESVLCGKCIIVVPQKLRSRILKEIHTSHMKIIKMKVDVRSFVWWPSINKEIENVARSCDTYLSVEYMLHLAHHYTLGLGQINLAACHIMYLVVVDSHSK